MHSNWRDCDAWRGEKLAMNTTSNEACKLYDASLTQLMNWKEDPTVGGLMGSINKMAEADPDFIMGQCFKSGMELLGNNMLLSSPSCDRSVRNLVEKAARMGDALSKREKLHVKAVECLMNGNPSLAVDYWEQILIEHPNDMHAIKFLHTIYFFLGDGKNMRQSIARVFPYWKPGTPLYNYMYGMYAFGLSQDNYLDEAEKNALKGLELCRTDALAIHTMSHVNEYRSSFDSGIKFLLKTESDWSECDLLSGHNYWHLALFHLEKNEIEQAVDIMDSKHMCNPASSANMVDAAQLMLRLKVNNNLPSDPDFFPSRWLKLGKNLNEQIDKRGFMYNDWHIAAVLASCDLTEETETFWHSLDEFINSKDKLTSSELIVDNLIAQLNLEEKSKEGNYLRKVNTELRGIYEAVFHYQHDEFDKVVEDLYPIRDKIYKMGGSNAQRDVFNLLLIDSAFKSSIQQHNKLGVSLINERSLTKPSSELTKRLAQRFVTAEQDN